MSAKKPGEGRRGTGENVVPFAVNEKNKINERNSKLEKNPNSKNDKKDGKDNKEEKNAKLQSRNEHQISTSSLLQSLETKYIKDGNSNGLSSSQIPDKKTRYGLNKMTPPPTRSEILKFIDQITTGFALLLWAGGILCFFSYGLRGGENDLYLGIVLCLVVLISGLFGYFQERKSSQLMESFKDMLPPKCSVYRDGNIQEVLAEDLYPGDIIQIKAGDRVPADIIILESSDDMQVDNASLTGESEPLKRSAKCTHENALETQNCCFFGTEIPKGFCTAVVIYTGDNTFMGQIARLAVQTGQQETPIARELRKFILLISLVALFLGVLFGAIGFIKGTDWVTNLVFVIGIIVANVPEGLLVTVTVCLTLTANKMYLKSVLVKNLEGVETLGSTSCICSDKTGTLTQNMMTVANVVYNNDIRNCQCSMWKESDVEYDDPSYKRLANCAVLCNNAKWDERSKYELDSEGNPDTKRKKEFMQKVVLGDGSSELRVMWRAIGDASESALLKFAELSQINTSDYRQLYPKVKEIPFNSSNKYQVSIHEKYNNSQFIGHILVMKGAPERILSRCKYYYIDGELEEITPEIKNDIEKLQIRLSKNGLRVLGFADLDLPYDVTKIVGKNEYGDKIADPNNYYKDYPFNTDIPNFPLGECWNNPSSIPKVRQFENVDHIKQPLNFIGFMAMIDPPRPQVPNAVERCKTAGIRVIMVTGDHPITAKAIAQKIGIIWSPTKEDIADNNEAKGLKEGDKGYEDPDLTRAIVVPGWEFDSDTPDYVWDDILNHNQIVFARTSPEQKLLIVQNCQKRNEVVAVTGDGVNDAPALRKADIGVAMGIMGSAVSKEAADMILLDDNFASIVQGVEQGRLIFDNLKKSIAYTLSSNIPEIGPFLTFITVNLPLPLDTVLILCIDLGTDMVPAISMAWEDAESDIMRRPPRDSQKDRLVTGKLVVFAYLQIGVVQCIAAFFTYFIVLNDYGFPYWTLVGLGAYDNWGKQTLYCKMNGGNFFNVDGTQLLIDIDWRLQNQELVDFIHTTFFKQGYWFWEGDLSDIESCVYAVKNYDGGNSKTANRYDIKNSNPDFTSGLKIITEQSITDLYKAGYIEYMPYRSVRSVFWDNRWVETDPRSSSYPGLGSTSDILAFSYQPVLPVYGEEIGSKNADYGMGEAIDLLTEKRIYTKVSRPELPTDSQYNFPSLVKRTSESDYVVNIASRMSQKEALHHAQCSYFVAIVIVQWSDLVICKTRMNSLYEQGMRNPAMSFGLLFETILAAILCYTQPLTVALGTRPIRLTHWCPAFPFAIFIVLYDEIRKYWMRQQTRVTIDLNTKQIYRYPGWIERNTYY